MMLKILRGNPVILTLTLMLNILRSILRFSATFEKHCNPLFYQILARMYSFFKKLKPAITDIMISNCSFDGKMQILIFWVEASFCPRRGVQSPSVQIPSIQTARVQAYTPCEKSPAFPVDPLRKF